MKEFLEKYIVYFIAFLMIILMCKIYALDNKVDNIDKKTSKIHEVLIDPEFTTITNE